MSRTLAALPRFHHLSHRLGSAFVLVALVALAVGLLNLVSLARVRTQFAAVTDDAFPSAVHLASAAGAVRDAIGDSQGALLVPEHSLLDARLQAAARRAEGTAWDEYAAYLTFGAS